MSASKHARQFAIKEIIASTSIASQDELRQELGKRRFRVTQATLSRDLRELGVVRVTSGEETRYVLQADAEVKVLRPLISAQVLGLDANEYLIVVRTLPGSASTVGEFVDVQRHPDIIGTVAGDNTLMVIPRSMRKTKNVLQFLKLKFSEGK